MESVNCQLSPVNCQLSIVIPVYCVEDTLDRCLKSIVSQSYANYEVILVDDGSPDRCPAMCDDWAGQDARIRVIHKEHGGLSDARNVGIDAAMGQWLAFIDSDDELGEGTLEQVMPMVESYDIVEFPFYRAYGSERQTLVSFEPTVYEDMETYWLKGLAYEHTYVWNKIYRKSLFDYVRFPKGKVFEDMHTLPLLLRQARRIATTDKGVYLYHWNNKGITATADGLALKSLLKAHLQVGWMDDRCYMRVLNIQISVYERLRKEILLPYRPVHIGTKGLRPAEKVKAVLLRVLGVKGVCELFYRLHKTTLV